MVNTAAVIITASFMPLGIDMKASYPPTLRTPQKFSKNKILLK